MRMLAVPLLGLRFIKSAPGEHWITIHPHGTGANAAGENVKGRHVLIDGDGRIVGGAVPKTAQGKHITSWWKEQAQSEPKLHEHLRGHGVAFTHHPAGHLQTGHGFREGKNKWGKPEAEYGHVKVLASANAPDGYMGLDSAFADKDRIKALGAKFGPQIGLQTKAWYLPIDKLPKLLKEMPHAEVTAKAVSRYEDWAQSQTDTTQLAHIKKVENAATEQAQRAETVQPFQLPAGMKREAMAHGDLHNYQKAGVQFLLDQKRAILGHGVGLGKTLESITAARAAQEKGAGRFLILCPSSRKYGWQDEIQKFSDASSVVLDASLTPKQQQARWAQIEAEQPHFVITNYETLQKPELAEKLHALAPNVIADEAHRVKNSKAKTTQGFQQWKDAPYAWLLTATPFPNGQPAETYTMLSHTQPGVVGSWKQFARDHVVFQEVSTPFGRVQKPIALKNVSQLREKLQRVVQIKQMTDPDVGLQLPDRRRVDVRLDMTKEQHKMYATMADQIAGEIAGMSDADFQRASAQVLVKLKRLEQIALDPDLVREPDQRTGDLSPKESWAVETITDHLSDPKNRGMVVFCDTRLPLDKIHAALKKEGITAHKITGSESPAQRQETERQFSAGQVAVVLATSAAEEGMNLQHGSHTLMHLDVPWVPKSVTQREGRVHRQGQPSPFTTHFHVAHGGTVEDTKQGTLHSKARDIDALLGTHQAEDLAVGHALNRKEVLAMLGHKDVKKSQRSSIPDAKYQAATRLLKSGPTRSETKLVEELAEQIHNIWMGWAVHAAEHVSPAIRKRWQPMFVSYADLPEEEKQKDRIEAIALLDVVRDQGFSKSGDPRIGVRLIKSKLPDHLRQKVADGTAHWVTVKEGPLEGRHLLIEGARPEKGSPSHGKILAGHGIPAHVIEKISGATQAEHVPHEATPALSQWLIEHGHTHDTTPERTLAGDSHALTLGHGHQTQTVRNRTTRGMHEETQPGHLHVGVRARGGFTLDSAFADKDALKAHGARWDADLRTWYAPDNATLERILHDRSEFPHVTVRGAATHIYEHPGEEARHHGANPETIQREQIRRQTEAQTLKALPALEGSEKQVRWATEIRQQQFTALRRIVETFLKNIVPATPAEQGDQIRQAAQDWLTEQTKESSAKWWIDHRDHITNYEWMIKNDLRSYVRKHLQQTIHKSHEHVGRHVNGRFVPPGHRDAAQGDLHRWRQGMQRIGFLSPTRTRVANTAPDGLDVVGEETPASPPRPFPFDVPNQVEAPTSMAASQAQAHRQPLTSAEREAVRRRFQSVRGRHSSMSFARDKDGLYCHTHRARSKSYPSVDAIPRDVVEFIGSTG